MGTLGRLVTTALGALFIKPIGLGLAIGSMIGGLLFPSRRQQRPAQFANLQVTVAQKGEPIPVVYGSNRLPGTILWYGNFKRIEESQGGKGGGKGGSPPDPSVRYTASFAVGVCEGPVNSISTIWAGKDPIDFGLEGTKFSIYTGTASQNPDAHISGVMSGGAPTFREAITVPASGAVGAYTAGNPPVSSGTARAFYMYGTLVSGLIKTDLSFVVNTPGVDEIQLINSSLGTLRVGWPSNSAATNYTLEYGRTVLASAYSLAYRHTAYVAFKDWDLGPSATIPNFTFEVNGIGIASGQITGVASDNFNRTDNSTGLGANWESSSGTWTSFQVQSYTMTIANQANANHPGGIAWKATFLGNQFSRATRAPFPGDGLFIEYGIGARVHSIGVGVGPVLYGYSLTLNEANDNIYLYRHDGLTYVELVVASSPGINSKWGGTLDLLAIETFENSIAGYIHIAAGTTTLVVSDATYLSGGAPGFVLIEGGPQVGVSNMRFDDWTGGYLGGASRIGSEYDINPVEALRDFLTNNRYGPGINSSVLETDGWNTIATYAQSADLYVSPIIADRQPAVNHAEHLLSYFDGLLAFSQGVYKLKARRDETVVASITDADYVESAT